MDMASQDSAALSDAAMARQLELLMTPVTRHFAYPLPSPVHLAPADLTHTDTNQGARSVSQRRPSRRQQGQQQTTADEEQNDEEVSSMSSGGDKDAVLRALARHVCEDRVSGLATWSARLRDGETRAQECATMLQRVLDSVGSMCGVTQAVKEQSDSLSQSASMLLVQEAKLELVQSELQRTIQHFTHIDDLCHEVDDVMLSATSARFAVLFQELGNEMQFLSHNTQFKSAPVYAAKLSQALQKAQTRLKEALLQSFQDALRFTAASREYAHALHSAAPPPRSRRPIIAPLFPDTLTTAPSEATAVEGAASASVPEQSSGAADKTGDTTSEVARQDSAETANNEFGTAQTLAAVLPAVNRRFIEKLGERASLRRMLELRHNLTTTGAEAFGEEPLTSLDEDTQLRDILTAYRDIRVALIGPILHRWLSSWRSTELGGLLSSLLAGTAAAEGPLPLAHETDPLSTVVVEGDATVSASRTVSTEVTATAPPHVLPLVTSQICALLEVVLAAEKTVLDEVWVRADFVFLLLPQLVASIADGVYQAFRALLVRVDDVAELAETIEEIQAVRLRQSASDGGVAGIAELWVRMIQDTQERVIFRTSVALRNDITRSRPSKEVVMQYLHLGDDVAAATRGDDDGDTAGEQSAATGAAQATERVSSDAVEGSAPRVTTRGDTEDGKGGQGGGGDDDVMHDMVYLPGVRSAVQLLQYLYPTLEFSVFAVFAEEAVATSLRLLRELARDMAGYARTDAQAELKGLLCQLGHLLYLREELSRIDANITVVERRLDLSKLRESRLAIVQSSRESKEEVDQELNACTDKVVRAMIGEVTRPVEGVAHKGASEMQRGVELMKRQVTRCERLLRVYVAGPAIQRSILQPVLQRVEELRIELSTLQAQRQRQGSTSAGV